MVRSNTWDQEQVLGQVRKLLGCSVEVGKGSCAGECEGKPERVPRDSLVYPSDFLPPFLWNTPSPLQLVVMPISLLPAEAWGRSPGRASRCSDVLFRCSRYWQQKLKSPWRDLKRTGPGCRPSCGWRMLKQSLPACAPPPRPLGHTEDTHFSPFCTKRAFSSCHWKTSMVISFALVSAQREELCWQVLNDFSFLMWFFFLIVVIFVI